MRFKMPRDRVIASTCGLAIGFKKGEFQLVPPAMYAEVIAAGGVSEDEIPDDELPEKPPTPEDLAEREKALFAVFTKLATRNQRNDFTAGGMPHLSVLAKEIPWEVTAKERDAAWTKFLSKANDE